MVAPNPVDVLARRVRDALGTLFEDSFTDEHSLARQKVSSAGSCDPS